MLAVAIAGGAVYFAGRDDGSVEPRAMLDRYCVGCHNDAERAGDLSLERLSTDAVAARADVWEAVVRKVRTGFMPPSGEPRPQAT
ncbi:MAG TPA: c-type cytochrome domain-containing protein, partial [Gammaproteobacteria bacterium]